MIHYILPSETPAHRLPFFLAMEEWAAMRCGRDEGIFFSWQVDPTVIFGRNQEMEAEVNVDYCRANGIQYYRRKSGGGCVFADRSNVMLSFICNDGRDIATTFRTISHALAHGLQSLGIDAEVTGRNDVTILGRKVSGMAFYRTPSGTDIIHTTLLYDSDMAHMANAITPSRAKLESKKVTSVPSRITTLHEHTSMSLEEIINALTRTFCDSEYHLSPADIAEIEELEKPYYRTQWIEGRKSHRHNTLHHRLEDVGDINVRLDLDTEGRIAHVDLTGDFFLMSDLDKQIIRPLIGVKYNRDDVAAALAPVQADSVIAGLERNQLVNLFF